MDNSNRFATEQNITILNKCTMCGETYLLGLVKNKRQIETYSNDVSVIKSTVKNRTTKTACCTQLTLKSKITLATMFESLLALPCGGRTLAVSLKRKKRL